MRTIYKYPLHPDTTHTESFMVPAGAVPLTAQVQDDTVSLWALVDTDAPLRPLTVHTIGTGHDAAPADGARYLVTVQQNKGKLVWHIFVRDA